MHLNSSLSLTCRASRSSYFDNPNYFIDARFETNPLLISSSITNCCCCCCCCCANNNNNTNLIYNRSPKLNPSFLYNGLRQSTLIQFSPSKRLINHGRRRQYCNNISDSDRNYYYEKLYSFKDKRKLQLGKGRYACSSYEDKKKQQFVSSESESDGDDYVTDVEILLDLLTEEVGLENIRVRKQKRIDNKDVRYVIGETKSVKSGSVKRDLNCDKKGVELQSKVNREGRKEGGSCSSYYSVSSTGDYDSENDVEVKHNERFFKGETSSEYKDDRKMDSYRRKYDEEVEENVENVNRRQEFGKEENVMLKKNTAETYYGNQEWRKKSEKKLNVESSQNQSQVSLNTELNSQQKTERITDESQSMKYKRFTETSETDKNVIESSTNTQKRYSDTENKLIIDKRESADRVTRQDEYRRQSNVTLEASRIHEIDKKQASSSSSLSSRKPRLWYWEDDSTEVSGQVEDRKEEKNQRIDQLTTLKDSEVKSQQSSEISDTRITNTESNIGIGKEELNLETSSSAEKVTIDQQVDLRRKNIEDKYSLSGVELESGPTKSVKTGRRTTKASSFNVGMTKQETSTYKALKLNPEPRLQETRELPEQSSGVQRSEIYNEDAIASADEQQKSSSRYVGEFVKKAKHELSISEVQHEKKKKTEEGEQHEVKSSGEDSSGISDQKDGPSDEMWNESGVSVQQLAGTETDAPDLTGNDESVKKSGRSLWNVIGDVVRLRWGSQRSETQTPKSGGGKGSSNQSTSSERWFSGHDPDDSNDENVKTGITKSRKESSKLDSPLLLSSSSNTNQGSSSKTMSPLVTEESSFPLPAIRMRRSPVVKRTSETAKNDASTSGKMDQVDPKPLTQVPQTGASGSGKMVIVDQPVREIKGRKLARIDQVSKDRFDEWEEAYSFEAKQRENDEFFMREALLEAKKAADFWEVPVGAVLVQDGKVIARGYNLVEDSRDSTAHAEMICIREASNNLRSWRLSGTTLYVTLEPCPMCAGAILQARIDTVVWGAPNKLLGADGSWIRLFPDGDGGNGSDKPPAPVHPFHPNMVVRRGVLSAECADVMQQFFQLRRKKKEKKTEAEPPTPPPPSCLPISHHHNSKFLSKMHDAFSIMFCL